ncbi:hypothetical protein KKF55_02980 [Patescibacteria group bacterium]|nr:hypothetical protein [Patescibacteria group bacterium]
MYTLKIHRDAEKELAKSPQHIKKKALRFFEHLMKNGIQNPPYPLKPLKGKFKKSKFWETIIDKDYRIIFRKENDIFLVRYAGTHNKLGTG